MRRIQHLQLISTLNVCPLDRARRQFNHRMDAPAHAADSPRAKLRPYRAYAQLAVERDHVNRKPHPEGMHTRRWLDPEARIWLEPLLSQQSDQPSGACVRDCDPGSDHSRPRRIPNSYLSPLDDSPLSLCPVLPAVLPAATPISGRDDGSELREPSQTELRKPPESPCSDSYSLLLLTSFGIGFDFKLRRLSLSANYQDAEKHHESDGCNNTHDQGHIHRNFLLSADDPANSVCAAQTRNRGPV